jgi:hypothetical protein
MEKNPTMKKASGESAISQYLMEIPLSHMIQSHSIGSILNKRAFTTPQVKLVTSLPI